MATGSLKLVSVVAATIAVAALLGEATALTLQRKTSGLSNAQDQHKLEGEYRAEIASQDSLSLVQKRTLVDKILARMITEQLSSQEKARIQAGLSSVDKDKEERFDVRAQDGSDESGLQNKLNEVKEESLKGKVVRTQYISFLVRKLFSRYHQ